MRRWFLSYNSQDARLAEALESELRRKDPSAAIYFAPKSLRPGAYWMPALVEEIAQATGFVLLVGPNGLGPWQTIEYYEAYDRRAKERDFPLVLVLIEGQPAPGLPFLRQLHWIVTADPASEKSVAQLLAAASDGGAPPGELWRHTAPYRGLAAMTEADADFFFGRDRETAEAVGALAAAPDRLTLLIGNSGVGKSSLAQAGIIAALMRQTWPEADARAAPWPQAFSDSRRWCVLKFSPSTEPVRALVEPFLRTWQFDAVDPVRARLLSDWTANLVAGSAGLRDLLDATEARYRDDLKQPAPPTFLLYIDQGEELYLRAEKRQRRRFSELLAAGLGDRRLHAMMSLRADFFGELQKDEALHRAHRLIDVPPLREAALRAVVGRPASLLQARFESERLAADIARRTAEDSATDAGALPLLSYLLDDMWTRMVARDDGILRLPAQAIDLGGVLVERGEDFLSVHPDREDAIKRILTLKLATVRENGEPVRRRAHRSEFSDEEWRLVGELADHPNRLVVTAVREGGEAFAEIAHETVFRHWDRLRQWISEAREFLIWKSALEADRRAWSAAPARARSGALLMGLKLAQAQAWLHRRAADVEQPERDFIAASRRAARWRRARLWGMVAAAPVAVGLLAYVLTGALAQLHIPATLQDSLMARLDRAPRLREVAQLGSVLGREFAYDMISALAGIEEEMLQSSLGQLVAEELLYQRGRPPRSRYLFKHALIQDAAYQSLLKRTRQQYHQRAAKLIEDRFPEVASTQPELVAHHCAQANCPAQPIAYWHRAGMAAASKSANLEAIDQFRRGLAPIWASPFSLSPD